MTGAPDPDEPFRPPLPMEDRLWRHPSEVAASQRASASSITVSTIRTPIRHAFGLATLGAVGGALVVTGLFLSLGSNGRAQGSPSGSAIQTITLPAMVPVIQPVPAERWSAAVVEGVAPGIAQVVVVGDEGVTTGSGVMFRSDGYLLSSHGLIGDATTVEVALVDGSTHEGTVLGTDSISGLGVIQIEDRDSPTAALGIMTAAPELGDYAVAVAGLADPTDLTMANLSALSVNVPIGETQNLHGLLQIGASMPSEASGGGLVDDTGSVIGIVVDVGTENATYAVPIAYARKVAADVINYGHAQHAWLGVKGINVSDTGAADLGLDGAVRVQNVLLDSPAYHAGIQKGDLIVAIDDDPIISMTELILELRRHPPGDNVVVKIQQDGHQREKPVELQVRAADNST